jgi:hypothetical protein
MPLATYPSALNRLHIIALGAFLLIVLNSLWLNAFSALDNRLSDLFVRHVAKQLTP